MYDKDFWFLTQTLKMRSSCSSSSHGEFYHFFYQFFWILANFYVIYRCLVVFPTKLVQNYNNYWYFVLKTWKKDQLVTFSCITVNFQTVSIPHHFAVTSLVSEKMTIIFWNPYVLRVFYRCRTQRTSQTYFILIIARE